MYKDIAQQIKNDIIENKYKELDKLPSELKLAEIYNTTKMTIRKALSLLIENGYIHSIPKKGYYISTYEDIKSYNNLNAGSLRSLHKDASITTKVISFYESEARGFLAKKFSILSSDIVYNISRIRYINNIPYTIENIFMPKYLFDDLTPEVCSDSIYKYVRSKDLVLYSNRKNICAAVVPQKFTDIEPKLLNKVVLQVENTGILKTGQVFEYSISYQLNQEVSIITHYDKML